MMGNRILYDQGVVDGYGHVSARDPRNPERFLMSRARAPGLVEPSDIMEFGMDGEPIRDDGRPIYSERFIHSEIYLARPDVNGVVHSHSPTVVPFTVTNVPLQADPRRASSIPRCRCSTPATPPAGPTCSSPTASSAGRSPRSSARTRWCCCAAMAMRWSAPSVRMAVYRAVYTEANAKLLLQAKMLGGPINYLAPEEAAIMESSQMTHRPGHGTDRIWELLKSEAIARTGRPRR